MMTKFGKEVSRAIKHEAIRFKVEKWSQVPQCTNIVIKPGADLADLGHAERIHIVGDVPFIRSVLEQSWPKLVELSIDNTSYKRGDIWIDRNLAGLKRLKMTCVDSYIHRDVCATLVELRMARVNIHCYLCEKPEYFDIVNDELDTDILPKLQLLSCKDMGIGLLPTHSGIKYLKLHNVYSYANLYIDDGHVMQLETMYLRGRDDSDHIKIIAHSPQLKYLKIVGCVDIFEDHPLPDEMPHLETLIVKDTYYDEGYIPRYPSLKKLVIKDCD
jgi:hypothetical protein